MPQTTGTFLSGITTNTTPTSVPSGTYPTTGTITWDAAYKSVYSTNATTEDIKKLTDKIDRIEKHLFILNPDEKLQKEFPALQEAYEAYQIILKLVGDGKVK